jgi:hypothetical protein
MSATQARVPSMRQAIVRVGDPFATARWQLGSPLVMECASAEQRRAIRAALCSSSLAPISSLVNDHALRQRQ